MLDFLLPLKKQNPDCYMFFGGENPGSIAVEGHVYKDVGTLLDGSEAGNTYHIILVKDHETDPEKFDKFDFFEAILIDPLEYISGLIDSGWYGIVAKKTTTSHEFIQKMLDNIKELL